MDLERYIALLKKTIHVRIMEMYNLVELSYREAVEDETTDVTSLLKEPLYTMLEDEQGYLIVIDLPGAVKETIFVDAVNNKVHVKCRARDLATRRGEVYYDKTIVLPEDADVSKLNYWFDNGRLYLRIPRS